MSLFSRHVLPAEKIAAIQECVARGMSVNATAKEVGCNRKTVMTYRRQWIDQELQRAYDLLWDSDGDACDAVTANLPDKNVRRMLDAWLDDQDPKTLPHQMSRWN